MYYYQGSEETIKYGEYLGDIGITPGIMPSDVALASLARDALWPSMHQAWYGTHFPGHMGKGKHLTCWGCDPGA